MNLIFRTLPPPPPCCYLFKDKDVPCCEEMANKQGKSSANHPSFVDYCENVNKYANTEYKQRFSILLLSTQYTPQQFQSLPAESLKRVDCNEIEFIYHGFAAINFPDYHHGGCKCNRFMVGRKSTQRRPSSSSTDKDHD